MTKEERKEHRNKNKELRKIRKSLRKEKFELFIKKVNETPELPEDGTMPDYQEKFKENWSTVKSGLEFVVSMKLTGKKLDAKINEVIELGDSVVKNPDATSDFQDKLLDVWKYVRLVLIAITVFVTKDEDDEKIDKFIEIGDWISGNNE